MKFLLDTCVLLRWLDSRLGGLSTQAMDAIANPNYQIIVSAVSAWEICIKQSLRGRKGTKKIKIPGNFWPTLYGQNFHNIGISHADARAVSGLPSTLNPQHKDPFDRMLIAQANRRGLTLVTTDNQIWRLQQQYKVTLLRA